MNMNTRTHSPLQVDAGPHQGGVAVDMDAEEGKRQQQFALRHDVRSTGERVDSVRAGLLWRLCECQSAVGVSKGGVVGGWLPCVCCSLSVVCVSYMYSK